MECVSQLLHQQHTANDHDEVQEQIDVCMEEARVNVENPVQEQRVEIPMDNDNIAVEGHIETPVHKNILEATSDSPVNTPPQASGSSSHARCNISCSDAPPPPDVRPSSSARPDIVLPECETITVQPVTSHQPDVQSPQPKNAVVAENAGAEGSSPFADDEEEILELAHR